jgi:hypothetical protein
MGEARLRDVLRAVFHAATNEPVVPADGLRCGRCGRQISDRDVSTRELLQLSRDHDRQCPAGPARVGLKMAVRTGGLILGLAALALLCSGHGRPALQAAIAATICLIVPIGRRWPPSPPGG